MKLFPEVRSAFETREISWKMLESVPIVAIRGRGEHASCEAGPVYPEAVKEGLYHDPALAELTTANFRLISTPLAVQIRIQLSPGVDSSPNLEGEFFAAISNYVRVPYSVTCYAYNHFPGGMSLDYERKFRYVEN